MKKTILLSLILFVIILTSCSHKNEFGSRRIKFSLSKIRPNNNDEAYKIIDTTKVYVLVSTKNKFEENTKPIQTFLKFYANGRVGHFRSIDFGNIATFNPLKADSYLYRFANNKFVVQIYFKHPACGECFIKKRLSKKSADTIELASENSIDTYKALEIPQNYLIYKPDW